MTVARKSGVARSVDEEDAAVSESASESLAGNVSVLIATVKSVLIGCVGEEWKKTRMLRLILKIESELQLTEQ